MTTGLIQKLLKICSNESYRIDPWSEHRVPTISITNTIMDETGLTPEEINAELDRLENKLEDKK